MKIDFLALAPHKGLYSPMGIGVMIALKPLDFTVLEGGTGTNSLELEQPSEMPERIESGTVNLPGIFGVKEGIRFLKAKGILSVYKHEFGIIDYIYNSLLKLNKVELLTGRPIKFKNVPVLPFNIKGLTSDETANYLSKKNIATRAGLHCAPSAHKKLGTLERGCVRISPSFFSDFSQADYLIKTIKKI